MEPEFQLWNVASKVFPSGYGGVICADYIYFGGAYTVAAIVLAPYANSLKSSSHHKDYIALFLQKHQKIDGMRFDDLENKRYLRQFTKELDDLLEFLADVGFS